MPDGGGVPAVAPFNAIASEFIDPDAEVTVIAGVIAPGWLCTLYCAADARRRSAESSVKPVPAVMPVMVAPKSFVVT